MSCSSAVLYSSNRFQREVAIHDLVPVHLSFAGHILSLLLLGNRFYVSFTRLKVIGVNELLNFPLDSVIAFKEREIPFFS